MRFVLLPLDLLLVDVVLKLYPLHHRRTLVSLSLSCVLFLDPQFQHVWHAAQLVDAWR